MCGIGGIFATRRDVPVDSGELAVMARALAHRGPDGQGVHTGPGFGLAHRRLAIVDLAQGAQPMDDGTGAVWVTFNGEIYNHLELRAELEAAGHRFRTRSDTEVLVHGWRAWGEALPERLRGMFAFALVDTATHTLFLARDRLGKKPLHYLQLGDQLLFASELKGLLALPRVPRRVRPEALAWFYALRYVPDPHTAFAGIHKLPPAHSLVVRDGRLTLRRYWALSFAHEAGGALADLETRALELLDDAVRVRLMGEVPLGAFLSGGVDSYAVVESMARATPGRVVACTIGFPDPAHDERAAARAAAAACRATLHEAEVGAADLLDQEWFASTFDEPFADESAVPTYHVSRLARSHVTVALSGDGGDEAFAGYRRYRFDRIENRVRGLLPRALWSVLGSVWPKADFLPRWLRGKRTLQNLALDPAEAYARSVSAALPEEVLPLLRPLGLPAGFQPLQPVLDAYRASDAREPLGRAAAADFATYLPGDILAKVDRASMAVSLEVRCPLLDHRVVEFAAALPARLKLLGGASKGFLRHALRGRLPATALRRRKQGFSPPLRRWLAGPLGTALEAALREGRIRGYLDVDRLGRLLGRHRAGVADHTTLLWASLVLERFLRRWQP
ncbi:MAG: asparagine synthase (glutamine-hydrolyzing) [Planctomycetes bacterium]|nr:asparagine synthase (glutamine-hydrolyzing) [Planctomycetota bacterium]